MLKSIASIEKAPWKLPLDWKKEVNHTGEPRVSFPRSVRSELTPAHIPSAFFSSWQDLPLELQNHTISLCDRPTLYALMQCSSALRCEAKKLFWSDPNAWYFLSGKWLLDGGYAGETHHTLAFLIHVERVEIHFDYMSSMFWNQDGKRQVDSHPEEPYSIEGRIHTLWQSLQIRCPRVTHVIVTETRQCDANEPLPHELATILRMPPPGISVTVSILRKIRNSIHLERSRWQRVDGRIELVERNAMWRTVQPPPKVFRGPVGAYQQVYHTFGRVHEQRFATRYICIEARERHHFDGRNEPFTCIRSDCNVRLEKSGDWIVHALATNHDTELNHPVPLEEHKDVLERREVYLKQMHEQDINEPLARMSEAWGEPGDEGRAIVQWAWWDQLENDPLYAHGKPPAECSTWQQFLEDMGGDDEVPYSHSEDDEDESSGEAESG
jgi:hypothetical protein